MPGARLMCGAVPSDCWAAFSIAPGAGRSRNGGGVDRPRGGDRRVRVGQGAPRHHRIRVRARARRVGRCRAAHREGARARAGPRAPRPVRGIPRPGDVGSRPGDARERLAAMSWPGSDPDRARGALRRTPSATRPSPVGDRLEADSASASLRRDGLAVDVWRFRELRAGADHARAVAAWSGDLLVGAIRLPTVGARSNSASRAYAISLRWAISTARSKRRSAARRRRRSRSSTRSPNADRPREREADRPDGRLGPRGRLAAPAGAGDDLLRRRARGRRARRGDAAAGLAAVPRARLRAEGPGRFELPTKSLGRTCSVP